MPEAIELRRTDGLERQLRTIDCLYAAGCAELSWDRAIAQLCQAGGFDGCALSSFDRLQRRPVVLASHGLAHLTAVDASFPVPPRNPLLTADVLGSPPGTVLRDRHSLSPGRLAATSSWTAWMQRRGFAAWAGIIVGPEGTGAVCLEIYCRPTAASGDSYSFDLLDALAPHLSRAWRLGHARRWRQQPRGQPAASRRRPDGAAAPPPISGVPEVAALRAEFGLTRAEARIALYLANGASLPNMADTFDVKLTTIRSQLQQVFAKTGTSRQAELVALLLNQGYVAPVEQAEAGD